MLVIGKNPVFEILKNNPKDINKMIVLKKIDPDKRSKEIVRMADELEIPIHFMNDKQFLTYFDKKNKSEGIDQGIIAFIKDYEYTELRTVVNKLKDKPRSVIAILDEITDPHNFGAIIRSAVCLGVDAIVIPKHNSAEVNHTVMKTSSGTAKMIDIAMDGNLNNSIRFLKDNGYWIAGADLSGEKFIQDADLKNKIGIVLGSEGSGMRKSVKENCDFLVKIPITGKTDSLNVSVSAGIIFYEILRQNSTNPV